MNTLFATKKGGQLPRGHTCCQLYVTDKGFIYVVSMKRKSEVLLAIKQFAKDDMIYIKTQVFRLLRYYSRAPRKIARSDWATQNITHNMTSSLKQPYGVRSY